MRPIERISVLRVKTGLETQRVGVRAFDSDAAPEDNSPAAVAGVPDAARSSRFREGDDSGKSSSARQMRAKTRGEPEVISRGSLRTKDKTVQFSEAGTGTRR